MSIFFQVKQKCDGKKRNMSDSTTVNIVISPANKVLMGCCSDA